MQVTTQGSKTRKTLARAWQDARPDWQSVSGAAIALIGVRWGAWLIAAGYVLASSEYRPDLPVYVDKEPTLLIVALAQTMALTGIAFIVLPRLGKRRATGEADARPLLVAGLIDFGLATALVYISGGWGSPFFHMTITALIVPAFLLSPRRAMFLAVAYVISYILALYFAGLGPDGNWDDVGRANLFGHLMTGVLVVGAVQVLASLTRELARERDEKQALAAQEERARIAREIHDGIAQSVYMLSLNLETAAEKAEPGSRTQAAVSDLIPLSKQILMEVRHYIFDLRPLLDGDQSLREALANQVREFTSITGVDIDLAIEPQVQVLDPDASVAIYRTVQEALANAYRHGAASQASVKLNTRNGTIELAIDDNGSGFDVEARSKAGGHGLGNMEERARGLGGYLEIRSRAGEGTTVRMMLPTDD